MLLACNALISHYTYLADWTPHLVAYDFKPFPPDKMVDILQTTISNVFTAMELLVFWLKISLKLVSKVSNDNKPVWVQLKAWLQKGAKPSSEPMMILPTDA